MGELGFLSFFWWVCDLRCEEIEREVCVAIARIERRVVWRFCTAGEAPTSLLLHLVGVGLGDNFWFHRIENCGCDLQAYVLCLHYFHFIYVSVTSLTWFVELGLLYAKD